MSNEIRHCQITIDLDIWHPHKRQVDDEIDDLIGQLKEKKLLHHAGNVKLNMTWE